MCGIAGVLDPARRGEPAEALADLAARMAEPLAHRGPDDAWAWADPAAGLALGHRRLSILDLSPAGRQPMLDGSGRYVLSFNGEIYNFRELRRSLKAQDHAFRGSSDTEVLVEAVAAWGLEGALERFSGMFAISLWDRREQTLHLVRDRLGIKPLYYHHDGALAFASELKGLKAHPAFQAEVDRDVLAIYFRHNYVPSPYCIYRRVRKLRPGELLTARLSGGRVVTRTRRWWCARSRAEEAAAARFPGSLDEAADELETLLRESVSRRTVADVPVGAFLSGGLDSSTVAALMQAEADGEVRTFTIGFREEGYDEAPHAARVARHLGTDHTEMYVTPPEAREAIHRLPRVYDEPFADPSQIPTLLLSELTRRDVKVSLSGDGGDELFGGYVRYRRQRRIWRARHWLPPSLRRGLAAALRWSAGPERGDGGLRLLDPVHRRLDVAARVAERLAAAGPETAYLRSLSYWRCPSRLVPGAEEPPTVLSDSGEWADLPTFLDRMMYLDACSYLPDDLLTKLDRASMAAGLEARVPLLDHRVVEFAWSLPPRMKLRDGRSKRVLRRVLYRHVPAELVDRPKMGFGISVGRWLRGPLRGWAEDLLDPQRIREDGLLDPAPVIRTWEEHVSGRRNWEPQIWGILMFLAWRREESGAPTAGRSPAASSRSTE